jgi:hypothetical protein
LSHLCNTGRTVTPVTSVTSRRRASNILTPSHGDKNRDTLSHKVKLPLSLWHCQISLSISGETTDTLRDGVLMSCEAWPQSVSTGLAPDSTLTMVPNHTTQRTDSLHWIE